MACVCLKQKYGPIINYFNRASESIDGEGLKNIEKELFLFIKTGVNKEEESFRNYEKDEKW